MEPQSYQPLSVALHVPSSHTSQQQHYLPYASHATSSTTSTNGIPQHSQQREEEEEEEDDDEVVEEELEHRDQQSPVASPRPAAVHPSKSAGTSVSATATQYSTQVQSSTRDDDPNALDDSKRKPGRPRGSRNRKPRASTSTSSKAPAGSQHPGFYQYPPAPGGSVPNQNFYDFQWRALNLCSEFYNAAEELIKNASPMVIAQCYQLGPATKVDPLALIGEAKRVCDTLLANPSQLAGQPPPATPTYSTYPAISPYGTMAPPPAPTTPSGAAAATANPVINNPQSFIMPLGAAPMPPAPGYPAQPYYPAAYPPAPGPRYAPGPYYYGAPQSSYYPPPPSAQGTPAPSAPPASTSASVPPPPTGAAVATAPPTHTSQHQESAPPTPAPPAPASISTSATTATATTHAPAASTTPVHPPPSPASGLSAFSATTGDAAPGGTQGAWSEAEIEKLKRLAERSKTTGNPQNRGEIEWDWVVQQWGNSRTRHQILLKATSLGLKESTTRGTKRRRDPDPSATDTNTRQIPPPHIQNVSTPVYAQPPATVNTQAPSPAQSSATSNPPSAQASPATQPMRPPSSSLSSGLNPTRPTPATSSSGYAWPMPTIAASNSPILTSSQVHSQSQSQTPSQPESSPSNYYRRPTQPSYGGPVQSPSTQNSALRPPSAHGVQPQTPNHHYMYRPLQNGSGTMPRRENGL